MRSACVVAITTPVAILATSAALPQSAMDDDAGSPQPPQVRPPQPVAYAEIGDTIASYASISGDSGAPIVFTDSSGSTKFLGLHVGRVTLLHEPPSGQVIAQTSGLLEDDSRTYQFGVFSTWDNVKRDLPVRPQ